MSIAIRVTTAFCHSFSYRIPEFSDRSTTPHLCASLVNCIPFIFYFESLSSFPETSLARGLRIRILRLRGNYLHKALSLIRPLKLDSLSQPPSPFPITVSTSRRLLNNIKPLPRKSFSSKTISAFSFLTLSCSFLVIGVHPICQNATPCRNRHRYTDVAFIARRSLNLPIQLLSPSILFTRLER